MNILERFSSHLRETLARAIRLATELKNKEVEPLHLLFALSVQKGSLAAELIGRFKITPQTLEQALVNLPGKKTERPALLNAAVTMEVTPLSRSAKTALEKALFVAEEYHHTYVGSEHLLAGLLSIADPGIQQVFKVHQVKSADLQKQLDTILGNASHFPQLKEINELADRLQENLGGEHDHPAMPGGANNRRGNAKEPALDYFATELTAPEMQPDLDPLIGREAEIERVVQIICRRTKNNPVLLGEPGVGKTAIVEGLAKRIVEGNVPDMLLNKKIYALDLAMLIAGTIYRGEFEARLRQVIDEVSADPDVILFIDEVHNIVGAGSNQGTLDAGNILKPALARGQIRCIGATTPAEFKKYIENDAALERRFQPIQVNEPSVESTIAILKGIKKNYEEHHRVSITPEAIELAVRLAERYITNKFFPDKAIDLIDETAAAKRLTLKAPAWQSKISLLKRQLEKTILAKETAAAADDFKAAVKHKTEEDRLEAALTKAEQSTANQTIKMLGAITGRDVIDQLAKITGAAPAEIMLEAKNDLLDLGNRLKKKIIGQNQVIDQVVHGLQQARLGLGSPNRPLASFLFVGESGVGKTELAKAIAGALYPGKNALIKLNMSEYNEAFGVSKLLGSPAGYVGYKEANSFTDQIKTNPHSVVLFDEIDKAHREVARLLLQILENGEINDATGKKISLRQAIIILTTTAASGEAKKGALGFGGAHAKPQEIQSRLMEKLKEQFSPEIINRLDQVALFNPLDKETLAQIATLEISELNDRLKRYHTAIKVNSPTLAWLLKDITPENSGAREVRRLVKAQVERLIAELLLNDTVKNQYHLRVLKNELALR